MTQLQYLVLAFGLVWLLLALYIAGLHRRTERARREISMLHRLVDERRCESGRESGQGSGRCGGSY